jgi:hypothetical protein
LRDGATHRVDERKTVVAVVGDRQQRAVGTGGDAADGTTLHGDLGRHREARGNTDSVRTAHIVHSDTSLFSLVRAERTFDIRAVKRFRRSIASATQTRNPRIRPVGAPLSSESTGRIWAEKAQFDQLLRT